MGIKLKCKVKVKHNFKKLEQIPNNIIYTARDSVEDILKNIRGYAIRLERGHNADGILMELVDISSKEVKSRVYASPDKFMNNGVSYLWFEYFGTGEYAEQNHIGKTKHFKESGYTEWLIPVTKIDRTLNYPIMKIGDSEFYVARGSKANHFMADASFKAREQNKEITIKKINEMLKECCK